MTTTASDVASLDAASGLLALISAASSSNDFQATAANTNSCPVSPQVVAEQRRQSVTVSDISDDDDESSGEGGRSRSASDAELLFATASAQVHPEQQQHQTKKAYRAKLGRPIGSSSFPTALMTVLASSTEDNDTTGASFLPDDRTFAIHNVRAFCDPTGGPMQTRLRISSFRTFLRKLDQWGFVIIQGRAAGAASDNPYTFAHPSGRFVRSEPNLARTIRRKSHRSAPHAATTGTPYRAGHNVMRSHPGATLHPPTASPSANTVAAMEHQLHLLERRRAQLQRTAQRMTALDRSIRDGVRYSDDQVGTATRNVVGAAMRVLERDEALRKMLQSI